MELLVSLLDIKDLMIYKEYGVTGIVLADKQFSLASPVYFNKDEIKEIVALAFKENLSTYILVNKMMFDEDLNDLEKYLMFLKDINISGIYFADMAVLTLAKKLKMEKLLVFAPRAPLTNSYDGKVYLDEGIKAVELADEITLKERLMIGKLLPNQLSVLIHGHLIMSFSRRLLLTNYFSEIKKDQLIQDNYDLSLIEETRDRKMPIYENDNGTVIYQAEVTASFNELLLMLDGGINIFRIDAMFLSKDDLFLALKLYQKVLKREEINLNEVKFEKELSSGYYYIETNLVK